MKVYWRNALRAKKSKKALDFEYGIIYNSR